MLSKSLDTYDIKPFIKKYEHWDYINYYTYFLTTFRTFSGENNSFNAGHLI